MGTTQLKEINAFKCGNLCLNFRTGLVFKILRAGEVAQWL